MTKVFHLLVVFVWASALTYGVGTLERSFSVSACMALFLGGIMFALQVFLLGEEIATKY